MTTATIRKKMISYMADIDDKKLKAIYTVLENDINQQQSFTLTDAHLEILDEERKMHKKGSTKSYSWTEAKQLIRKK